MAYEYSDIPDDEKEQLRLKPDYVLEYIAPMECGWKERAELVRRYRERTQGC